MVRHLPDLLQGTVLPLIGRILRQPRIPLTLLLQRQLTELLSGKPVQRLLLRQMRGVYLSFLGMARVARDTGQKTVPFTDKTFMHKEIRNQLGA